MTTTMACDHATMTTEFCPRCGKKNAVQREPGEIERMRERLKVTLDASPKNDKIQGLIFFMFAMMTLDWVSGQMADDKYIELFVKTNGG